MGVVVSKWRQQQQLGGRRGRRRRSTLEDESWRLQMASTAALEEQHAAAVARERSRHRQEQEVAQLRACRLRCQNHGTTMHHQCHVEEEGPEGGAGNKSTSCRVVVEHGREWESETVERWKRLYLEIKTELDDLIESYSSSSAGRERRCCRCSCGAEAEAEAEAVELRGRLSAMERDAARREREMDILRQSLRILTLTDNNTAAAAAGSRCAPLSLRRLYCCLSACPGPGPGPGPGGSSTSTASTCSST